MEIFEEVKQKVEEILENAENLTGIGEKDLQTLKDKKDILISWSDELMDSFYRTLLNYPKTAKVFEKIPVERVKAKNKKWYEEVISGKLDKNFYEFQFLVGLIHIYYGIENNVMIFMAQHLKSHFLNKAVETFETEEAIAVFKAFSKLVDFLIALTVEGYTFTLREALMDIAGYTSGLVDTMMGMKLEEIYRVLREGLPERN